MCVLNMWLRYFATVFLSIIQTEADRAADTQAFANRTLQSYCPYMNFCHRNATRQPDFINDEHGTCCLPCSCDDDCVGLENCCPDKDISHLLASPLDCKEDEVKPVSTIVYRPLFYRVIDKCPKPEQNPILAQKCIGENRTELTDYIWVSDPLNGKIFQNRYCANCHGVDKFELWNIETDCTQIFPSNINSFANMLVIDPKCNIINVMPEYLANVTWKFRCFNNGQSNCEKTTSNVTLVDACTMYNLPVYESISGFVFRNVFCQLCVDPLWELKTCSSIDNFFGKRTETSYGFLLDFRNLDEADNDRLQCDVDCILDTRSNQCLKLRCPLGKAPYKGECKTFLLPTSHLTLTVYYYLRVEWEDTYLNTKNSALNGTQIGKDVVSHFLNESLRYNKKCKFCTLEFNMMPPNQIHGIGDFILKLEMRTSDVCPLETLQVDLLEPVDKNIAVKITGGTAMTVDFQVSLLPEEKVHDYEIISQSMGALLLELIHRPCIRSYVVLRDSITCPQVEITESVIQSITDYHVKTTLGLLFNSTAKVSDHDTAVMYMCGDDYFDLVYRTGMAVRLEDPRILTLIQVTVMISLFIVR